jgi:predicted esterase
MTIEGPHQGQPVRHAGRPLSEARGAMVLIHGRGATAESILTMVPALDHAGFAYLAPQASGNTWYPYSFLAPIEQNEPGISSGMAAIDEIVSKVQDAGIPSERTILLGFSQGACLTLEYAARHAQRYGGVAGLSGGLIGPDGTPRNYSGSLERTPVFVGCSDIDAHVPVGRVRLSADVLRSLGGDVTLKIYPGMGHLINEDELSAVRGMMEIVAGQGTTKARV